MRSHLFAAAVAAASITTVALVGTPAAEAAATKAPDAISNVNSWAGPGVGEVTISWKTSGKNTTSFDIETGLTAFSKSSGSVLPKTGRNSKTFSVSGSKRSVTLSAQQVAAAGAAPATANHLFFRVFARNGGKSAAATRAFPQLQAVAPKAVAAKSGGTAIRVGSFNVRTAKYNDGRNWLKRSADVARTIKAENADVVAVQELSPGRADGKSGATTASIPRQTESLVRSMKSAGAGKYKLVRTTSYVLPGTKHSSQGARILYNTDKLSLVSTCAEKTKNRQYNTSCSFDLPIRKGESKSNVRSAAYAEFKSKSTGKKFLFVSVHLDHRQGTSLNEKKSFNNLRAAQIKAVYAKIGKVRKGNEQVIVAGDFNSWQNHKAGNAAHDFLIGKGFYDTASAREKVNMQYDTYNNFKTTQVAGAQGFGNRIDMVLVLGAKGAKRFENVTTRVDSTRASDHNMIVTDFAL